MPKTNLFAPERSEKEKRRSLTLVLTPSCNLRCKYCYEGIEKPPQGIMPLELAKETITRHMESEPQYEGLLIDFFGGEPLLAFPLLREVVDWFHSREWPKKHHFMISTNGTLLTDEIKRWLIGYKECLTIGLSLDGNRTAHNLTRDGSYDLVAPHIPFFKEHWPTQPMKMTIGAETIPHIAASVITLEEMGLEFTANIVFEDIWGDAAHKEALLAEYERQLDTLVEYYAENDHLFPVMPLLKEIPEALAHPEFIADAKKRLTRFCGAGHEMTTVDWDGRIYPCHRFLPWITNRVYDEAEFFRALENGRWEPEECVECKLLASCPTCAGYNWQISGEPRRRSTFHCHAHQLEVLAAAKLEALKLSRLTSTEINALPAADAARLRRRTAAVFHLVERGLQE